MILLVDSYDSFTNNLSRLTERITGKDVVIIKNDSIPSSEYRAFLDKYSHEIEYIVVGPGPGSPSIPSDVGIISFFFQFFKENPAKAIPILGICLGFQCLCYNFGNAIKKLDNIKHGQVYNIYPLVEDPIFENSTCFPSVRYHSLYIGFEDLNDEIVPLSVCYEPNDDKHGSSILMSGRHKSLPFYGVQYHPESVCSDRGGDLIAAFDRISTQYNEKHRSHIFANNLTKSDSLVHELVTTVAEKTSAQGPYTDHPVFAAANQLELEGEVTPIDICDFVARSSGADDFILLNSASIPGEWSIIGIPTVGQSEVITHSIDSPHVVQTEKFKRGGRTTIDLEDDIWTFISGRIADNYVKRDSIMGQLGFSHDRTFPFLGGYLGLFSYEEGRHIVVEKLESFCESETPDLKLIFIERFLLYDHASNKWFIFSVSTRADDTAWCEQFGGELQSAHANGTLKIADKDIKSHLPELLGAGETVEFEMPSEEVYKTQFEQCQEYLRSGDSYELCLTVPTKIRIPASVEPWDIYKILAVKNPSPFSCFMSFDDVTLISSSPERFLTWRGDDTKSIELRPIKGTVKNTPDVDIEAATRILKTPKEMGENLMIVDLIRHDLHHYIESLDVSQLMKVEEYKTVFQLVSVIKGDLKGEEYHGIDILKSSLPPGSMTGAPKKRSVELLQQIEEAQPNGAKGGRRGIYSGVVGYWSITDDSDWSVIIRSVFHYHDDQQNDERKLWRIGAGGAITVLSNVHDEWEEMQLKLVSALQAFK